MEFIFILAAILAFFLGILAGTFTGIMPGIHINLVSALLLGFSSFLFLHFHFLSPIILIIFLVAMATAHTFIDFIPSIFLGAPDEDNFLSILPGHEMLIKGEAYSAVIYTLFGSISALFIILILSPIFYYFLPAVYPYAERIMPLILITASIFLIYFEKTSRVWAIIIFLMSGLLGIASINLPIKDSLLPLFTGLFGISSLATSLVKKQKIPAQKIIPLKKINIKKSSFAKSIFAALIGAPLCSFLPGMGSGQAAVIGSEVTGNLDRKEFLILLGAINTIVTGLSFITLYAIGKARTGIAVAIGSLTNLTIKEIIIITLIIFFSGIFSVIIAVKIAKLFAKYISKINYRLLSAGVIVLLGIIVLVFSGILGIILLTASSILGLLCIKLGIRRTHLMGCLIIPAIVFYLI